MTWIVLGLWFDDQCAVLIHNFLHVAVDEFIEGIQLLAHQSFCIEERCHHRPGVVLHSKCPTKCLEGCAQEDESVHFSCLRFGVSLLHTQG
jgi:hypothetical protein